MTGIDDRGFSLIEVMLAMVILAFAVVGVMGMHQWGEQGMQYGANGTRALAMAESRLEAKRTMPWEALLQDDLDADGMAEITMQDDGEGADEQEGDGIYTATDPAATLQGDGPFTFRLYAAFAGSTWTLMAQTTLAFTADVPGVTNVVAAPNPFNPATTVSFKLGQAQRVRISVYDLDGRRVARLADREFPTGTSTVDWTGRADSGRSLASGTYLILVDSPGHQVTTKVTLLK